MVGDITVDPPLLLAPMEDVTNLPFRRLVARIGRPGLMFTEFVSAMAIHYGAEKTLKKMRIHDEERPLGIQIFGSDPAIMADTAALCEDMGADVIDINMGCWVPKVCKTGSGAALLKDPEAAEAIVAAVVRAVNKPVSVKVRAGWHWDSFAAPELAKRFQEVGASMLTLHARFAKQGFDGQADWRLIERMRKAVTVPLIGNGDVRQPDDAIRMLRETGCDGVMVGRAAIGNPWSIARIRAAMVGEAEPPQPSLDARIGAALQHLRWMIAFEHGQDEFEQIERFDPAAELRAVRALRGQLPLYIKGYPGAALLRGSLVQVSTLEEANRLLTRFAEGLAVVH
ncbi:MAG: putative tRNA-dihydrouridine synthase [Fimbriimonadaceae bacterium]|nr:putative tRNA-dihydrouridine synthase [Fimbriimonadaceae bacterium]